MGNNFAPELISLVMTRLRVSQQELARRLEVDSSLLSRWRRGTSQPGVDKVDALFSLLGTDWRAAVDHQSNALELPPIDSAPIPVVGRIAAGTAAVAVEDIQYLDLERDYWAGSPQWGLGQGSVRYLRVYGTSMEPDYPDDSMIAVRLLDDRGREIRKGTPVIFQEGPEKYSFKLYEYKPPTRTRGGMVLGVPLNREHDTLVWEEEDVIVWAVVLGRMSHCHPPDGKPGRSSLLRESDTPPPVRKIEV